MTLVAASLSVIVLTCVAWMVPVPYVKMSPGPVFDTLGDFNGEQMLVIGSDVETFPTSGTLDFTTVAVTSVSGEVSLVEAIRAYFDDDVAVVPRSLVYPEGFTAEQSQEQGAAQLTSSKDSSRVAALRAAGYEVPEVPVIGTVVDDGASEGILEPSDEVLGVGGVPVDSPDEVVAAVARTSPGDTISLRIRREGVESDVQIVTQPDAEDPDLPRIGVTLGSAFEFPVDIVNQVGDSIGGPSAGTMFALAIYDMLTPGELTGGARVAGTGEITPDGEVRPIGGIRQKMAGAGADDVDVFLVPDANCDEADRGTDYGMTLVRVTTLDDAIESLEALAEDPDAEVPSCS
ncbi:Lon protease (S16) C-terminal proteolytic domain protein [Aeromicrobium marinum DSM 15272]|uniref:Lon protease (S16) C-terminal proteolytic domain protein n=1 Tax=Aeromicrobium marinum DSM 15272 TaxID=585531 RepID=E2SEB7_9ACTN|nr:Lon protease (S16) C-terminal proteolytic domain protein [Aeromicrobium marinum DSM 15272]